MCLHITVQIRVYICYLLAHVNRLEKTPEFHSVPKYERVALTELYLGSCSYYAVNILRFGYKNHQLIILHVTIIPIFDNQTHLCTINNIAPTGIFRLPWLRFFRAFSSVVRQMPGYTSRRRRTVRALPKLLVLFCVLFVCKCTTATGCQPKCS
jgi:hypothetical protein